MRKQVSSLPKTKSGAPAFEMASRITLPYFTMLLFMKDEFIGRTMTSSCPGNAQCTEEDNDNHNLDDDNQNEETDLLQRTMEESGLIAAKIGVQAGNRHLHQVEARHQSEERVTKHVLTPLSKLSSKC